METRSPEKDGGDYFSRREPSAAQQTPRARRIQSDRITSIQTPGSPTSPRTPRSPGFGRSLSNFGSPGLGTSFRQDDDYFIFEFSHRYFRAGLGGEKAPRCQLSCSPEFHHRAGDYSQWIPADSVREAESIGADPDSWAEDYEFWQMDLRNADLGLIGDRIERALREAIRDHVLVLDDSKKRRVMLVIPPVIPHPLLSLLCAKIFDLFPAPQTITLLSSPTMSAVSAGLRSALVVDIGWASSTLSAVYEYREVKHMSTARSMKLLCRNMKEMLEKECEGTSVEIVLPSKIGFADAEDAVFRMAWCPREAKHQGESSGIQVDGPDIRISPVSQNATLNVPFDAFSRPVESSFLKTGEQDLNDDHDMPLPELIFKMLLRLPIDIRETCVHRIIFTGGGSNIPGLKSRILSDLTRLISRRGWDPVDSYGSAKTPPKRKSTQRPDGPVAKEAEDQLLSEHENKDIDPDTTAPAHLQPPLPDPVLARIKSRADPRPAREDSDPSLQTESSADLGPDPESDSRPSPSDLPLRAPHEGLRSIISLGAWTGASLLSGLRIPGLVEIERERFLQHGIHGGAPDDKRRSAQQAHRLSMLGAVGSGRPAEGTTWTLGIWA